MAVLLSLGQASHADIVLFQPAGDRIRVAPFVFFFSVQSGYFHCTELLFDILLVEPIFVLVQRFCSQTLAHGIMTSGSRSSTIGIIYRTTYSNCQGCPCFLQVLT